MDLGKNIILMTMHISALSRKLDKILIMILSSGVFVYLEKAFNTVDHNNLLAKLEHYRIRSVTNGWFRSYLSRRKQIVYLGNNPFSFKNISFGVYQRFNFRTSTFLYISNNETHTIIFCCTSFC